MRMYVLSVWVVRSVCMRHKAQTNDDVSQQAKGRDWEDLAGLIYSPLSPARWGVLHLWQGLSSTHQLPETQGKDTVNKEGHDRADPEAVTQRFRTFFPTYAHQLSDHHGPGFKPGKQTNTETVTNLKLECKIMNEWTLCKTSKLSLNLAKPFLFDFKLSNTEFEPL